MLRDKISDILYTHWNPIGVSGLPRNEYDSYIPEIIDFIMRNQPFRDGNFIQSLARLLTSIERTNMGLSQNRDRALKVAKIIQECLVVNFEVGQLVVIYSFDVDTLKRFHGKICLISSCIQNLNSISAWALCDQEIVLIYEDECIPA